MLLIRAWKTYVLLFLLAAAGCSLPDRPRVLTSELAPARSPGFARTGSAPRITVQGTIRPASDKDSTPADPNEVTTPSVKSLALRSPRVIASGDDRKGAGTTPKANDSPQVPGFGDEVHLSQHATQPPSTGGARPAIEDDEDEDDEDDDDEEEKNVPQRISQRGFSDGVRLDEWMKAAPDPGGRGPRSDGVAQTRRRGDDQQDTDLARPKAQRRGGGGGPTLEEEEEETEEDVFKSDLLMKVLGMEDAPISVFGWLEAGILGAPGYRSDQEVFGVIPNSSANNWEFEQFYVVVERLVEQNEKVNFGFRIDNLSGTDWIQYHMIGFNDHAWPVNGFGWEPVQFYGEVHLPVLTEGGVDIKGGRFFALPGYESAMAPARPFPSGSYMFGYSHPFTHFGMMSTWHVTEQLNVYNGAVNGWDRWIDRHYRWGYSGAVSWDSKDDTTNVTVTYNFGPNQFPRFFPRGTDALIPNGVTPPPFLARRRNLAYPDNNALLFTEVLIHKWTEDLTMIVETDQGYETNIPGLGPGGTTQNGAWYGLGGWLLYELTDHFTGAYRAEVFFDPQGDRTGFRDTFYEMTLGGIYKPWTWLWFRPEIRFDWANGEPPYKDEHSRSQFTFGFDTIFLF